MIKKIGLFFIILLLTACSSNKKADYEIKSITLTIKPSYGETGNIITSQWIVSSDGKVIETRTNDLGETISNTQYELSEDIFQKLIASFGETDFFSWPDDLSSPSDDGSYIKIEVQTDRGLIVKGGWNPVEEPYGQAIDTFFEYVRTEPMSIINVMKIGMIDDFHSDKFLCKSNGMSIFLMPF